jgi:galactonate dehydratase
MSDPGATRRGFLQRVAAAALGTGGAVTIGPGASAVSAWTGRGTNSVLYQASPAGAAHDLRITRVDPVIFRFASDQRGALTGNFCLLCRIETAEGIIGWGEGTNFPKVAPIATEIEMNRPIIVGQSAWDIEKIWYDLSRTRAAMHGSAVQSAISAVDIALWDIVGQKLGVPLYRLIGGKVNEKLRYYRSGGLGEVRTADAYAARAKQMASEGSIAVKFDPFGRSADETTATSLNRSLSRRELGEVIELVRGVRDGGPSLEIGIDVHAKFNTAGAIRFAKALEPFDVMFLEEPILAEQPQAMREVQAATSTPIAAGERLKSRFQMYQYIEQDAIRLYQPDAARLGGITEFRKAVAVAETHFIPFQPHNPNGAICLAAHLHLAASSPNFTILEQGRLNPNNPADVALLRQLFGEWRPDPAYFFPPERPGLGVTMSADYVREHSVDLATAERN